MLSGWKAFIVHDCIISKRFLLKPKIACMKKIYLFSFVLCCALANGVGAFAQGGVYFRENFATGTGPTSDPMASTTVSDYLAPDGNVWKFFGLWLTSGTSCLPGGTTGTGNRHVRSTNNTGLATTDTAYMILPNVDWGIYDVKIQRSRNNRRFTFWTNETNTTNPADAGWTIANVIPKVSGLPDPLCLDSSIIINRPSARRLMIKMERNNNCDVDSIALTSIGVLPARLGASSVQHKNDGVLVSWEASNEINVKGYYVQRSNDGGITFVDVAFVPSANKLHSSYTISDAGAGAGLVYYRIKAQDFDGRINYGKTLKIQLNKTAATGVWVINPVRGRVIDLYLNNLPKGTYAIQIIDAAGKVVAKKSMQLQGGSTATSLPLQAGVARGLYFVNVNGAGFVSNKRVIVE